MLLRGGIYRGTFTSVLRGTRASPIAIRSFPGEWAVLDGGVEQEPTLAVEGADTTFASLEFTKTDPDRRTDTPGTRPRDLSRADGTGIHVTGPRTKLIDVVVHDHAHGIGLWRQAIDSEVRGAVIFNNGWLGPDRGHGHGIYVQNLEGTKRITDSLIFRNFGWGIHGYGVNGHVNGLTVEGVTSFGNGDPSGAPHPNLLLGTQEHPVDRVVVRSSVFYHHPSAPGANVQLGLARGSHLSAELTGNTVIGGGSLLEITNFDDLVVGGNAFHSTRTSPRDGRLLVDLKTPSTLAPLPTSPSYSWDGNSYVERATTEGPFASFLVDSDERDDALTFSEWQSTLGVDGESTYSGEAPATTEVVVRPTGGGRAIVTVLNWSRRGSLQFDPAAAGLRRGGAYEILDAQDYLGEPVVSGVWNGGPIEVPLGGQAVTEPYGAPETVERAPIEFGAFVLIPRDQGLVSTPR